MTDGNIAETHGRLPEAARQRPVPPGPFWREAGRVLGLFVLTAGLLAWSFPPRGVPWFAFVALVPWAVAACRASRAWLVHWLSFFVGFGFFVVTLRWLHQVTDIGHLALSGYLAAYWTLAAWALRTARRHGVSPVWSLPVIWVACEYLRGTLMSGFPWLFLAHGFYGQLPLIQISDLVGAHGVSFIAAMVNGLLVELALRRWPIAEPRTAGWQTWAGAGATIVLLAATIAYGVHRLGEVDFENDPSRRGPRVAVVQHDFPLVSKPPYSAQHDYVMLAEYLRLAARAAQERPDLLVFPETPWNACQNISFVEQREQVPEARGQWSWGKAAHEAVSAFARGDYATVNVVISTLEAQLPLLAQRLPNLNLPEELPRLPVDEGVGVTTLLGSVSIEQFPKNTYPRIHRYNSALIYDADGVQRRQRYDKMHLVPFGEIVPFRQARFLGIDMHWLYRKLNALSPFSYGGEIEYSCTPGEAPVVFELASAQGVYHFGVPICYEDATPSVPRQLVWEGARRRADFLVNISNDAWFLYSVELPQHLAICVFRAVENRVSVARAVNTGISAFIDPDGRVYATVNDRGRTVGPGIIGYEVQPVYVDARGSLYGRFGDWFAQLCTAGALILWIWAVIERWVLAFRQRVLRWLRK